MTDTLYCLIKYNINYILRGTSIMMYPEFVQILNQQVYPENFDAIQDSQRLLVFTILIGSFSAGVNTKVRSETDP